MNTYLLGTDILGDTIKFPVSSGLSDDVSVQDVLKYGLVFTVAVGTVAAVWYGVWSEVGRASARRMFGLRD